MYCNHQYHAMNLYLWDDCTKELRANFQYVTITTRFSKVNRLDFLGCMYSAESRALYCGTPATWIGADIQQNSSDFPPKIGDTGQNSEIQPPNPNRIAQRRRPKGFSVFLQRGALKPLWIQLNVCSSYCFNGAGSFPVGFDLIQASIGSVGCWISGQKNQ